VAELSTAGHDAIATEGANSQYDVVADGTLVFSKQPELARVSIPVRK
jgi:hypothetical protein